ERIERFEVRIPQEVLTVMENSANSFRELEREYNKLLDDIDRLEDEKRELRRKREKSAEENEQLNAILEKLDLLNEKVDAHDKNIRNELQELRTYIWKTASQTIDTITMELKKQNAQLSLAVISGNRQLFELIEATSIAVNSKIDVQANQLAEISNSLELSNEHLENLLGVLDGESNETKASIKDRVLGILQEAGGEAAVHRGEIEGLMTEILDKKADKGGRLNALKSFFGKAKNWIQEHPKVAMALRVVLTGAMTAMGVPIPII
ncbi:MAG: hypothetical protein ACFFA5_04650, partial [Promethearchaeota archaeon]